MKKLLVLSAIAASLATLAPATQAATATGAFTVGATLTSACTIGTFTNVSIAYTANAATASDTSSSATITCTRLFAPTNIQFNDAGTDAALNVAVASTTAVPGASTTSGAGYLADTGLHYTINASLSNEVLAGTAATAAAVGSGRTFTAGVTVTIPQQYGKCATASCATTNPHTRTLTVTY